jgi:hypothetical protein
MHFRENQVRKQKQARIQEQATETLLNNTLHDPEIVDIRKRLQQLEGRNTKPKNSDRMTTPHKPRKQKQTRYKSRRAGKKAENDSGPSKKGRSGSQNKAIKRGPGNRKH